MRNVSASGPSVQHEGVGSASLAVDDVEAVGIARGVGVPGDRVVAGTGQDDVVAGAAVDRVAAVAGVDVVVAAAASDRVAGVSQTMSSLAPCR